MDVDKALIVTWLIKLMLLVGPTLLFWSLYLLFRKPNQVQVSGNNSVNIQSGSESISVISSTSDSLNVVISRKTKA